MPGPELGVKLYADAAEFQSDMGRAAHDAEKAFGRIEAAAVAMGVVLAEVAIRGAQKLKDMVAEAVNTRAALDDMADKGLGSVQMLDGLRRSAEVSGVEMVRLDQGLTRLAKTLTDSADDGKKGAAALRAIGLEVDAVRAMKPADAFMEIARALGEHADGASKVAVAEALMGKGAAELLLLMKDLAETGAYAGRITAQQAAEAERLQKEWRRLSVEGGQLKDMLATALIPALANTIEQLRQGINIAGGFWNALLIFGTTNPFKTLDENIAATTARLERLRNPAMISMGKSGAKVRGALDVDAIAAEERRLAFLQLQRRQAMRAAGADPNSPEFEFAGGGITKTINDADLLKEKRLEKDREAARLAKLAAKSEEEYLRALYEERAVLDDLIRMGAQRDRRERERLENLKHQSDIEYLLAQERKLQERDDAIRAGALRERKKETDELKDAARELGMTFSSAFEDAVVSGKKLSEVLKGIAADIARIILRRGVTEPFANAVSEGMKGFSLSGLFSGLFGGGSGGSVAGSSVGLTAMADGGPVYSGRPYLVGERGPELFMPRVSGNIIPNGGAAGTTNITFQVNSLDPRSAAQVLAQNESVIKGIIARAHRQNGRRTAMAT